MNKTSKTPLAIGSFFAFVVWLVRFIVSAVTGIKGRLGDIAVLLFWGGRNRTSCIYFYM
ncbi:hypothetical protein V1L52_10440 [Treponema sp. HNW]|uniref:hypothetical protein n=1 Tax=Treponema sp. HNW TaxID=3116654 RepID=UPI003D0A666D